MSLFTLLLAYLSETMSLFTLLLAYIIFNQFSLLTLLLAYFGFYKVKVGNIPLCVYISIYKYKYIYIYITLLLFLGIGWLNNHIRLEKSNKLIKDF